MSELMHHGVDGMKWGKRNGPPYPLKGAGKQALREQREREESLTKKVQGMSTSDLDAAISRLKKEQEYKRLTRSDIELGKNYIIGLGILGATALAGTLAVTGGTKAGQAIVATGLKKILDPAVFKAIYAKK